MTDAARSRHGELSARLAEADRRLVLTHSANDVLDVLEEAVTPSGFTGLYLALASTVKPWHNFIRWWPAPYRERYLTLASHPEQSPILRYAEAVRLPFTWADMQGDPCLGAGTPAPRTEALGLRGGLALPVHGKTGLEGVVALNDGHPPDALELAMLLMLSQLALARLRLVVDRASLNLSARECEVLQWAAWGKTMSETGGLMGVSVRTIEFHQARIVRKLGASNRTHAVAEAVRLQLVTA